MDSVGLTHFIVCGDSLFQQYTGPVKNRKLRYVGKLLDEAGMQPHTATFMGGSTIEEQTSVLKLIYSQLGRKRNINDPLLKGMVRCEAQDVHVDNDRPSHMSNNVVICGMFAFNEFIVEGRVRHPGKRFFEVVLPEFAKQSAIPREAS